MLKNILQDLRYRIDFFLHPPKYWVGVDYATGRHTAFQSPGNPYFILEDNMPEQAVRFKVEIDGVDKEVERPEMLELLGFGDILPPAPPPDDEPGDETPQPPAGPDTTGFQLFEVKEDKAVLFFINVGETQKKQDKNPDKEVAPIMTIYGEPGTRDKYNQGDRLLARPEVLAGDGGVRYRQLFSGQNGEVFVPDDRDYFVRADHVKPVE